MVSRDQMYMDVAVAVAGRAGCLRRDVGAVITRKNRIVAAGYNGPPSSVDHCTTCLKGDLPSGQGLDLCPAIHAEANAILQAAKMGHITDGGTLYVTTQPCWECLKMSINSGIKRIVYLQEYASSNVEAYYRLIADCFISFEKF